MGRVRMLVAVCSGCVAGGPDAAPTASVPTPTTSVTVGTRPGRTPTLLTWTPAGDGAGPEALVAGVVAVNAAGCVTIGHAVLLAPSGSVVLPDGSGVHLTGWGDVRFGETGPTMTGGYGDYPVDARERPDLAGCRSPAHPEKEWAGVNAR